MKKYIAFASACFVAVALVWAANYQQQSFINGSSAKFWVNGTNGVTFLASGYNTNRTYITYTGVTNTPYATNTSGSINPSWSKVCYGWALADGAVSPNATISIAVSGDLVFTNTVVFKFVRSVDGTYYDTTESLLSVTNTPGATAVISNTDVPASFLKGCRYLKLHSIVAETNDVATGYFVVNVVKIGGYVP